LAFPDLVRLGLSNIVKKDLSNLVKLSEFRGREEVIVIRQALPEAYARVGISLSDAALESFQTTRYK
jgi:hypothetical protein